MAFQVNSEVYCNYIRDRLTDLVGTVRRENCLNLQALNIHAEQFYANFLNLLFDWQLGNANALRQNAKGIDLIDEENHIVVQVSSDKTRDKVQKSLEKSEQYQGCHFYFVAIVEKVSFRREETFQVPPGLTFDPINDVFSVTKLEEIVRYTVIEKQKALYELMRRHFSAQQEESDGISSALRASLEAVLEKVREDHPSFRLMKPDEIDHRLFPDGVEVQPFTAQGTQAGDDTPRPVWDRIAESWQGEKNRAIVIEGEGGIGKTVTLLSPPEALPVPAIYIHLYELVKDGKCLSISDWLDAKMKGWAKEIDALAMGAWKNGPSLLLLCDGVNEVPAAKRREVSRQLIDWNSSHPGAQFIIVSRPLDEDNLQGMFPGAVHIRLEPLSRETAIGYLQELGQEVPDDASPVWAMLCRPLFLILYAKTGRIAQKEAEGYPLDFREAKGPGAIIWNYLQREALHYPDESWVLRCAVACEYILPAIAYDMLTRYAFTISVDKAETLIMETLEKLDENRLPRHLASLWRRYKRVHRQYPALRSFDWETTVLNDTYLLLLLPEQAGESEDVYNFPHQNFRDCLAGVYLVNQAEMAGENELPEVWKHGQNHLALDYAAELMDPKTVDRLWETNRKKQQYNQVGYEQNHTTTCALLELEKRRNPPPQALEFSGMDLRGLSLIRYMKRFDKSTERDHEVGQGSYILPLFQKASLTEKTMLDRAAFKNEGHSVRVTCMAVLPNGCVVSGSSDNTLRVWDAATGQCLQTLKGHKKCVECVAVLPDRRVVSGSWDGTLRVWDATTGQCLQTLEGHKYGIACVAVLSDGRVVSGSDDTTLRVWDTATGQCLQTLYGHKLPITCVAVFPDGRVISGSDDHTLRVWDAATRQCLQTLTGHEDPIKCVTMLPDGLVVSGSDDSTLKVWDATSSHCLHTLAEHESTITCVAVLPDGRVVSGSIDNTLRVWDAASGQCLQTLEGHEGWINCVAVFPDGRVVSGSEDSTLRVWDAATGQCLQTLEWQKNAINRMTIFPDGRVVSGSNDGTLRVWDATTGQCLQTLQTIKNWTRCMSVFPDGRVVSGSDDHTLRVWDAAKGQCVQILEGHRDRINCVAVLPDWRVASGSDDYTLRVWDAVTGQSLQTLVGHKYRINCVAVFSDGRVVSGSDDHTLRVWDVAKGQCVQILEGHRDRINCVAVLPDEHLVSGSDDGTLRVWDAATGQCLQTLVGHKYRIDCVAVLPDGRLVSGSRDNTLRVWDAATGQCLKTLKGHTNWIRCVSLLPDGLVISGSYDHTLRVWDAVTGQCLQTLQKHEDRITCAVILPDGRVVSGSNDKTLRVWDATTRQCLKTLEGHEREIICVDVLPDGRVVSSSYDETLRVWDADTGKCMDVIEATEVPVLKTDFSQACLTKDLAKLLWYNGARISQEDYEQWVKPNRSQ